MLLESPKCTSEIQKTYAKISYQTRMGFRQVILTTGWDDLVVDSIIQRKTASRPLLFPRYLWSLSDLQKIHSFY